MAVVSITNIDMTVVVIVIFVIFNVIVIVIIIAIDIVDAEIAMGIIAVTVSRLRMVEICNII